ncbi:hypothetical protein [Klebsiella aerogenes]|uniref:hypothetical protein n=1 Tax=Klebsiella aerogenes TaxID=548 RepID=UPI00227873AB|nr:hypothetical protein [Klebsiella aerogenes]MCY4764101.1 hypothetical protein [Klebsiella aerogenes]
MGSVIEIDECDTKVFSGYLNTIIEALRSYSLHEKVEVLCEKLSILSNEVAMKGTYDADEFLALAEKVILYFLENNEITKHIDAISLLCLIHCRAYDLYVKYNMASHVGEYFRNNWGEYTRDKNSTVNELILCYYYKNYGELVCNEVGVIKFSGIIKNDIYLSSIYGEYQKKTLIIWLYDHYFSLKEDGISFLYEFKGDKTIHNKILSIQK